MMHGLAGTSSACVRVVDAATDRPNGWQVGRLHRRRHGHFTVVEWLTRRVMLHACMSCAVMAMKKHCRVKPARRWYHL